MSPTRFEFKYVLDAVQEQALQAAVRRFMVPDPSAVKRGGWYPVTSLYFDTPQRSDYYDKSGGYLIRKKLRARIYAPSLTTETPEIWLEIKKKYDMSFQKSRAQISQDDWNDLQNHRYTTILSRTRNKNDATVLHEFLWYILQEGRRPAFFIRYQRRPYRDSHSSLRITFDSHIEANRHANLSEPPFPKRAHEGTIMEVKYSKDTLPAWLGSLLFIYNLSRESFSKYGRAIEKLHSFNKLPR
jgi:hypothetical protein